MCAHSIRLLSYQHKTTRHTHIQTTTWKKSVDYNLFYMILFELVFAPFFMKLECTSAQQHNQHHFQKQQKWHSFKCSILRFRLAFILGLNIFLAWLYQIKKTTFSVVLVIGMINICTRQIFSLSGISKIHTQQTEDKKAFK